MKTKQQIISSKTEELFIILNLSPREEKAIEKVLNEVWKESENITERYGHEIYEHNKIIRERLRYCLEQNGMNECKNCGLNAEDDLISMEDKLK